MLPVMDEELLALLATQAGVVSHQQARDLGVPATQLGPRGTTRSLTRVRAGAYALTAVYEQATPRERLILEVGAERLVTGVDLVAVGATAAAVHDLPVIGAPPPRLQLAERKPDRPQHHGRSTTLPPDHVIQVDGVPVTILARTAIDLARSRGRLAGVAALDAALHRDVSRQELEQVLAGCVRWPGVRQAREAVELADARAESPLESMGRVRFHEHGLPAPDLQVWLGDSDGQIARVDHYWQRYRTVAEADGALKYATPADLFAEKRREDRLREAGFEVVRYTWDEILRTPEVVVARVLAAFARASRRAA